MSGTAPLPADDAAAGAGDAGLEQLAINVIRGLAMDAPRAANSGHSGTAMALAPLAHVLWTRVMRHDPTDPAWPDRDRFVLSNGHASILLYSMLYLTGYGLTLDDLKAFRQWGSKTPGPPRAPPHRRGRGHHRPARPGVRQRRRHGRRRAVPAGQVRPRTVSTTTPSSSAGDGCFEEGISHEAASLAGHLGLGRLVYVYDDNHITIDGPTELSYTDNVPERFDAYGWDVDVVGEIANDTDALEAALRRAMAVEDKPSLIVLRSHIGWPSPHLTDTAKAHGDPVPAGRDPGHQGAARACRPTSRSGSPTRSSTSTGAASPRGRAQRAEWQARFDAWDGDRAAWDAAWAGRGLAGWEAKLPTFEAGDELATRKAVNACINATADLSPGSSPAPPT